MRPTLLLAAFAAALAITGSATAAGNPFGVTVVHFSAGSTPAQMRAAVAASGGVVVGDLSAIDALAVVPASAGFDSRVSSKPVRDGPLHRHALGFRPARRAAGRTGAATGPRDDRSVPDWSTHGTRSSGGTTTGSTFSLRGVARAVTARSPSRCWIRAWTRSIASCGAWWTSGSAALIPCDDLKALFGLGYIDRSGLRDCRDGDFEGHGTWVASRIAGALNGFASNGVAPGVRIGSYKVLAAGLGGLSTWILSGLVAACSDPRIDVVNMSIEAYVDPSDPASVEDYLLFTDAVELLPLARRTGLRGRRATLTSASNRVTMTLGGRGLEGVGQVSTGAGGIATACPAATRSTTTTCAAGSRAGRRPRRDDGLGDRERDRCAPASVPLRWRSHVGARDQLAYYSNYGSRIDLAAPGGARAYEIPAFDGGPGDVLAGGWGSFGALAKDGLICNDPSESSSFNSACFTARGDAYGWLQGTSMSTPNAAGVAALVLSAHHELVGRPSALVRRLTDTANRSPVNYMGPNDPCECGSCARRNSLRDRLLPHRPVTRDRLRRRVRRGSGRRGAAVGP